jgi:prevent-host-death family protein
MTTLITTEARANLYRVIDETAESYVPVRITSKRNNAVLLSKKDWDAIQETLYLLSILGVSGSIKDGLETDINDCSEGLYW